MDRQPVFPAVAFLPPPAGGYLWLCDRRKDYSPNNDIWTLRWRWRQVKPQVQEELLSGRYRFSVVERFHGGEDTPLDIWSSRDALVLKALAIVLGRHLIALGYQPGPQFKKALDAAFESQLDGAFDDEAGGVAWMGNYLRAHPPVISSHQVSKP